MLYGLNTTEATSYVRAQLSTGLTKRVACDMRRDAVWPLWQACGADSNIAALTLYFLRVNRPDNVRVLGFPNHIRAQTAVALLGNLTAAGRHAAPTPAN